MSQSEHRQSGEKLPPGIGIVRVNRPEPGSQADHFAAFGAALEQALENVGRAPGRYRMSLTLSGTVQIENPGHIIEYIVTLT